MTKRTRNRTFDLRPMEGPLTVEQLQDQKRRNEAFAALRRLEEALGITD